jgi:hypothetical protein
MATETTAGGLATQLSAAPAALELPPGERPYKPSWVDLLISWLERLPGPTWLAYIGIALVGIALQSTVLLGIAEPTTEDFLLQAFWAVMLPLAVWLMGYLAATAGSALDTFRPALSIASEQDVARLRYQLTTTPARPAGVILVFMVVLTPLYYLGDPVGSSIVGLTPIGMLARYVAEVLFGSLIFVLVYQSWRQLRTVQRIHAEATRVDLLRPAPLYAFSVLTSRAAIVIALIAIVPTIVAVQGVESINPLVWLPWIAFGVIAAAVVFALPLRGMQQRIIAEKRKLQSEVGLRLETTMAAIHRSVDAGEIVEAGKMNDALDALIAERELVDKLPTLPWRPGTLGALVSAIVLPLAIFFVQRLLSQFV